MELCVDLKEITRIPYHELETVYLSVNLTVLPYGKRYITGPSFGDKSIKFRPHCFKFSIEDVKNNQLSLTILSHLTDNRSFILSCLKIPLTSIPINGFARKSFETMLFHPISISPIVTLIIGINIDYTIEKPLEHPSIINNLEYDKYESPPILQLDSFGKLAPPQNYIDKCSKLVENNSDLFLKLISNDTMRKYVLDKASEFFRKTEDISCLFQNIQDKRNEKISNQSIDYNINIKFDFFQKKIDSDTKKVKFKKDSENNANSNNQKNKTDRSPQPPVEPKTHYQAMNKSKNKSSNDLNSEVISSVNNACNSMGISLDDDNQSKTYARQFSLNPKLRPISKTPTKSLNISTINRTDSEPSSQFLHSIDSPSLITQKSQFPQQVQQQPKHLPQSKVQAPQQPQTQQVPQKHQQVQQSIKIQPQTSQQKLRQQFQQPQNPQKPQQQFQQPQNPQKPQQQLQLPAQSRPQQPQSPFYQTQPPSPHHPPQTQSPFHQTQQSTSEIGIHKMISKKKANDTEIGKQKILQQKPNLDDKNQSRKQMKRSIMPNQKPNPPQIQLPITTLPASVENSGNPRRARQNP